MDFSPAVFYVLHIYAGDGHMLAVHRRLVQALLESGADDFTQRVGLRYGKPVQQIIIAKQKRPFRAALWPEEITYLTSLRRTAPMPPSRPVPSNRREDGSGTLAGAKSS